MNPLRISLLLLFVLAIAQQSFATHIVGGEITYRCLGMSRYEIVLTVYRDCYNGRPAFDDPAIVGVYQTGPDLLFTKLLLAYDESTNDTLPVSLDNPCLVVPPDVCVHKATYRKTVMLPYIHKGYTIVYQRCCRNRLIRNIPDPLNTGISFMVKISGKAQLECNNAATFSNWPPVAICVHQPINFDHAANDVDGDSLRYRLCTPLNGPDSLTSAPNPPAGPPYEELIWIDPPYNLSNLLGGVALSIDSITGLMTGIPNTIGNFVVGVCVDEFRDELLISTTRRDFQYNVADCGSPTAAFFVPDIVCDTLQVYFENQSQFSEHFRWYFDWPDDLSQTTTSTSPVYTFPDTGYYHVMLIAAPELPCSDTFLYQIHLVETEGNLVVVANPDEINRGLSTQLTADFPGAIAYNWKPNTNLSNAETFNPIANPLETTTYNVTATLPNGCEKMGKVTVLVIPPDCDEPFVFFPTGFSPNGDGENDVLKMESNIVAEVYWVVFNRWGERVFMSEDPRVQWNGRVNNVGADCPEATYFYQLKYRFKGKDKVEVISGSINLIR